MNGPLIVEIFKIIGAIVGCTAGVLVTYWKVREKQRSKEFGLSDNPERCGQHQEAINTLKERIGTLEKQNRDDHEKLGNQIGALALQIARAGGE